MEVGDDSGAALNLPDESQFLLLPRPDPDHFFETAAATTPPRGVDFEDFLEEFSPFELSSGEWDQMRQEYENGTLEAPPPVLVSTGAAAIVAATGQLPPPKSLPPEVEAPEYGTSLAVTGRKIISFNYTNKSYLSSQAATLLPQNQSQFQIQQQMQIRMQGQVGPKVGVNVDYDDTKQDKQDISVVYQGDPNEVVQNASFGDISLALPATEFVSYNKQLFGIRADLKYKGFSATFIGSRTKGTTKTKRFIGNTQFATNTLQDISYIRRQRYDLTFGNGARLPIKSGSERVWEDPQNVANITPQTQVFTADDLAVHTSSYTGHWNLLQPGVNYTMDYINGIVTFQSPIAQQAVLCIDYTEANGTLLSQNSSPSSLDKNGTGLCKLIKTSNDVPISADPTLAAEEVGYDRELKTYYSIGQAPIVPDNGQGNFILEVTDANHNPLGAGLSPSQTYPATIQVDFTNGLFHLLQPFGTVGNPSVPDPNIYGPNPVNERYFYVEYNYRLTTFQLEPNLVLQSETILVDGRKLARNVDYFIDYTSGFVTFFHPEQISATSVIDITYDVAPIGGLGGTSLLGARVSYNILKNWEVGSTVLYNSAGKPVTTPTLDDLPQSQTVYDFDSTLGNVPILPFLKGSFSGEYAESVTNPNLAGYAIIDNMEGIRQDDDASLNYLQWQIASNPSGVPSDPLAVNWTSETDDVLSVFPTAAVPSGETQLVLDMNYNFGPIPSPYGVSVSSEVSIVYPYSQAGLNFANKSYFEVVLYGDGSGNQINFHFGQINEDADGTGGTTLYCANGTVRTGVPKTEDTDCTGILSTAKDVGWLYAPAGKNTARYIPHDGKLETEDLNGNGLLDPQDLSGGDIGYIAGTGLYDVTAGSTITAINFTGWHTLQIPMNISTATSVNWAAIRQLRISLRQAPGGASTGQIKFALLDAVGNLWQPGQVQTASTAAYTGELDVSAISNVTNPSYVPLFSAGGVAEQIYSTLYGSQPQQTGVTNLTETSLDMEFQQLPPDSTAYTQRVFSKTYDYTSHSQMNFLLYGNADPANPAPADGSEVFFIRWGDPTDYWEADVPITWSGWRLYTLAMVGPGGSTSVTPTMMVNDSGYPMVVYSTGSPNLQAIQQIQTGLYNNSPSNNLSGTVWLDDIFLSKPRTLTGDAAKLQADFEIPGWMTFGGKYKYMSENFQTPTTVVTGQDNEADTGYLNFKRIPFFPLAFTISRTVTNTPNAAATGSDSNLVSLLDQGLVTQWAGTASGQFSYKTWPKLTLNYNRDLTQYDLLERTDNTETYTGVMSYSPPLHWRVLPTNLDLGYTFTNASVQYAADQAQAEALQDNFNTRDHTDDYAAKATFQPWAGTTWAPTYEAKETFEDLQDWTTGSPVDTDYTKERDETVGFNSNYRITNWLNPTANYNFTTQETYDVAPSSITLSSNTLSYGIGQLKNITRNAAGGVAVPLSFSQITPNVRPLKSLTLQLSYQLQDGDAWDNVEPDLNSFDDLLVRDPLHPNSPVAQLENATYRDTYNANMRWSPFEAYKLLGFWAPLQTLSITNNLSDSIQRQNVTGTQSLTTTTTLPDLIATMSHLEQMLRAQGWMSNGILNIHYTDQDTVVSGQTESPQQAYGVQFRFLVLKKYDTSVTWNYRVSDTDNLQLGAITGSTVHQDGDIQTTFDEGHWRFTPKIDYTYDYASSNGAPSNDVTVITPSILARGDLSIPRGLKLPFSDQILVLPNRIIWTTTLSWADSRSPIAETSNSDLVTLTTNADYEIAKNLRMTLTGGASYLSQPQLPQDEYLSYNFGTTFTFQF